jgi:hypothetical protein
MKAIKKFLIMSADWFFTLFLCVLIPLVILASIHGDDLKKEKANKGEPMVCESGDGRLLPVDNYSVQGSFIIDEHKEYFRISSCK